MKYLHPIVQRWFEQRFGEPTKPQKQGWEQIRTGADVLIAAPTGSGKTLAAFLICIDRLVRGALNNELRDETTVLYVSPLKALSNDIHRNLEVPLAELMQLKPMQEVRAAVRTGDTPMWERQAITKKPPHILVTTPESLYILLTAERPRAMLRSVRTVIVDEIHAIADDKRGAHLALSLARLDSLTTERAQRIGLSATVKPIEEVGRFLGKQTRIVNTGHKRELDLGIEIPRDELGPIASNEMWEETYDRMAVLIREHRTTLVFVNTRRLAERVAHNLLQRLGENTVLPHHGSLSRTLRQNAESRLKSGELKAVVATASLELGIDIGSVDLVCQVGSPRSFSASLQRIGRSRHHVGGRPKGRFFPLTRDELLECAAIITGAQNGELEALETPRNCLDILAQQIVASCATSDWREDDLFALFRTAYPYETLDRNDFDSVVTMLSEGIATSRGRSGAFLHRDQVNGRIKGRRGARLAAITSGGAIPENANYAVLLEPEGKQIGTLDEDFAIESMAGDIVLLGTHSWRIKRVEQGRVRVEDAQGAPPSVPFWFGEGPGRSMELSQEVSRVREELWRDPDADVALDPGAKTQALAYIHAGVAALGALPAANTVVAERFFDEAGGMQLILHAPFGSRINRAWGLALRKRFCRTFNFELQAAATDNGICISLSDRHSFPLELVFAFLKPETVEDVLKQALLAAPVFNTRWRWNATRALAVLRFRGGRKVAPQIQRMQSEDLLASVFPDQVACAENLPAGPIEIPDHPLVRETMEDCVREAMDIDGLRRVLEDIEAGRIKTVAIDTALPSPFSHEILNANPYAFLDDAPLEERRARAVQLRRTLPPQFAGAGVLDPKAIEEVSSEVWPLVRNADELHDALLTLIRLPETAEWRDLFEELKRDRRAHAIEGFWVATERQDKRADAKAVVRGWLECLGPITAQALAGRINLPVDEVATALLEIEASGEILRGRFTASNDEEWCNRRILARIHRLTLNQLRREIEPVSALDFYRFLCRWHHLTPGSQLHGVDGVHTILEQLQGYEIAAAAWEPQILGKRIAHYDPLWLDELCLSGEIMWGRLSGVQSSLESSDGRRIRPTRVAPITFFRRTDADWLMPPGESEPKFGHAAQDVWNALRTQGASFFNDLTRLTKRLPSEVEDGLWELVAAGVVTADGFENLRALIDPKRRRGEGRGRTARPRHAAGRWALLRHSDPSERRNEEFSRQLLSRWGVLFRDLLAREPLAPPWRDLLPVLRRMEAQGEIRGGRFVAGFAGEQFAKPEAIDLLRSVRRTESHPEIVVANADPLNLAGIILPGPRVSPLVSGVLVTKAS